MNIDAFLDKRYHSSKYNCAAFVCEVWKVIARQDISSALQGAMTGEASRVLHAHNLTVFKRLTVPHTPCLALFQANRKAPHVGIWLDGKILHITENGVNWIPLDVAMIGFNQVRFYDVEKSCNC